MTKTQTGLKAAVAEWPSTSLVAGSSIAIDIADERSGVEAAKAEPDAPEADVKAGADRKAEPDAALDIPTEDVEELMPTQEQYNEVFRKADFKYELYMKLSFCIAGFAYVALGLIIGLPIRFYGNAPLVVGLSVPLGFIGCFGLNFLLHTPLNRIMKRDKDLVALNEIEQKIIRGIEGNTTPDIADYDRSREVLLGFKRNAIIEKTLKEGPEIIGKVFNLQLVGELLSASVDQYPEQSYAKKRYEMSLGLISAIALITLKIKESPELQFLYDNNEDNLCVLVTSFIANVLTDNNGKLDLKKVLAYETNHVSGPYERGQEREQEIATFINNIQVAGAFEKARGAIAEKEAGSALKETNALPDVLRNIVKDYISAPTDETERKAKGLPPLEDDMQIAMRLNPPRRSPRAPEAVPVTETEKDGLGLG